MTKYSLNETVIIDFFKRGKLKTLHGYAISAYLMAGVGYMPLTEYFKKVIELTHCSEKTVQRWIKSMEDESLVFVKRGNIHAIGRRKLEERYSNVSKVYVRLTDGDLEIFAVFRDYLISQIAVLTQSRFKMARTMSKEKDDAASLVKNGVIEKDLQFDNGAGCSLSILSNILGIDKMTASRALKGLTKPRYNYSEEFINKSWRQSRSKCEIHPLLITYKGDVRASLEKNEWTGKLKIKYRLSNELVLDKEYYYRGDRYSTKKVSHLSNKYKYS